MLYKIFFGLIFLVINVTVQACSCFGVPCTFFNSTLDTSHVVAHVEIIGEDSLAGDHYYALLNPRVTVFRVIRQYTTHALPDTIRFYHGQGATCYHGLPDRTLGSQYVLKMKTLPLQAAFPSEPIVVRNTYYMELCDNVLLGVSEGMLAGHITRNRGCRKLQRRLKKISETTDAKKIKRLREKKVRYSAPQQMTFERFRRKWLRLV